VSLTAKIHLIDVTEDGLCLSIREAFLELPRALKIELQADAIASSDTDSGINRVHRAEHG
jgi:hypothetical protein